MIKLLKAAAKTGSATIATLFFGIISTKIMAIVVGAPGIGLLSLLRQARETALVLATVNGSTALVQGMASRSTNERERYIGTVLWITAITGIVSCGGMIYFAPQLAKIMLARDDALAISLVRWLSLPVLLSVFLMLCTGLLNGYRAIGRLALVSVASSFAVALLAYPTALLVKDGKELSFIWMMTGSVSVALTVAIFFLWKGHWLVTISKQLLYGIHIPDAKHFFKVAGSLFFTGLTITGTLLAIRALITKEQGLIGTGLFDVSWTLSMMYIGLLTKSFSTYYLPTLSGIHDSKERVLLMQQLFRLTTLLMIPIITTVVILKPLVIQVLYSNEFVDSLQIIRWMLIGDYLKITSWVFAFPVLAYADMRTFVWSEFGWNSFFLIGTCFSIMYWKSLEGIGVTFLAAYLCYLIFMVLYCRINYQFKFSTPMVCHWIAGLVFLLAASLYSWESTKISLIQSILWITSACLLSWLGLKKNERYNIYKMIFSTFYTKCK